MQKRKNIGTLLLEYGKVSNDTLEDTLRLQKKSGLRLGDLLIRRGAVTQDDIEWVLSKQLDIPFVIVENINLDACLLNKFKREFMLSNRILPLYETDEEIAIATDDPLNNDAIETIEALARKNVKISSANGEKIEEILNRFYGSEGVPPLITCIDDMLKKLQGSSFYRIDFVLNKYECVINVFGCGILKRMAVLKNSYNKEQILGTFESLGVPFLYDEHTDTDRLFLSIYPMTNRMEHSQFPAIAGMFGLLLPDDTAFVDAHINQIPNLIRSEMPVKGYIFISTKKTEDYGKTVFTPDSAPEKFKDFFVKISRPEKCTACDNSGCEICNNLGYTFSLMEGIYSSDDLKDILGENDGED